MQVAPGREIISDELTFHLRKKHSGLPHLAAESGLNFGLCFSTRSEFFAIYYDIPARFVSQNTCTYSILIGLKLMIF